eukprot:TRINITY_DN1246_c0_g1_i4.p2 TRINITY_DN1246_c0_g1~~TRINITY_DN1246_c0_g1_i4.p2  ORF type:complete len:274 (-),score=54.93 TRINITY_DN1246_c0_g1_i4:175-996(-)
MKNFGTVKRLKWQIRSWIKMKMTQTYQKVKLPQKKKADPKADKKSDKNGVDESGSKAVKKKVNLKADKKSVASDIELSSDEGEGSKDKGKADTGVVVLRCFGDIRQAQQVGGCGTTITQGGTQKILLKGFTYSGDCTNILEVQMLSLRFGLQLVQIIGAQKVKIRISNDLVQFLENRTNAEENDMEEEDEEESEDNYDLKDGLNVKYVQDVKNLMSKFQVLEIKAWKPTSNAPVERLICDAFQQKNTNIEMKKSVEEVRKLLNSDGSSEPAFN